MTKYSVTMSHVSAQLSTNYDKLFTGWTWWDKINSSLYLLTLRLFGPFSSVSNIQILKRSVLLHQIYLFWNACILMLFYQTTFSAHFEFVFNSILKCTWKCAFGLSVSKSNHFCKFQISFGWFYKKFSWHIFEKKKFNFKKII